MRRLNVKSFLSLTYEEKCDLVRSVQDLRQSKWSEDMHKKTLKRAKKASSAKPATKKRKQSIESKAMKMLSGASAEDIDALAASLGIEL